MSSHAPRLPRAELEGGRSAMGRASDSLPFRPYVYRGVRGPVIGRPQPAPAQELTEDMPADIPAPPPASRCEACGYLVTAPGHLITCA